MPDSSLVLAIRVDFGLVEYLRKIFSGEAFIERLLLCDSRFQIVDLIFGVILLVFKEANNVPMSTTWVFLGLLAGREIAMSRQLGEKTLQETWRLVFNDAGKAFFGLVVSVALAYLAITLS